MFANRRRRLYATFVLVMDALGFANRVKNADADQLFQLWDEIDRQYTRFRGRIPNTLVIDLGAWGVFGTREMETLRLNDMFIVFSRKRVTDPDIRYLVSASLLYHQMLLEGFIPRGGLGFGLIARGDGLLIGDGFIDGYESAEKRPDEFKDICAVEISPQAMGAIRPTKRRYQLICFYRGRFFLHPYAITDPDLGSFDRDRVLDCLKAAGTNERKLSATAAFLEGMEDWEQAQTLGSQSRTFGLALDREK
jgi:hypothetical protein